MIVKGEPLDVRKMTEATKKKRYERGGRKGLRESVRLNNSRSDNGRHQW